MLGRDSDQGAPVDKPHAGLTMPPVPVTVHKIKLKKPVTATMTATGVVGGSQVPAVHPPRSNGAGAVAEAAPSAKSSQAPGFAARSGTPPSSAVAGVVQSSRGREAQAARLMPPPPRPMMMPPPAAVDSPSTLEALVEAADKRRREGTHLAEAERLYRQALKGL